MRILYIDIDSLRPDHLGCYGYHRNTSPNIDELAQSSTRFENVYISDAPCLPSRTALWSGRCGFRTGVVNHGGTAGQPFVEGPGRGFRDTFGTQGWMSALRQTGMHTATVSSFGERHAAWHWYAGFNEILNPGFNGLDSAEQVSPIALDWIKRNARRDSWFLHVNYWDPHTPYRAPKELGNPFREDDLPAWMTEDMRLRSWNSFGPHSPQELFGYGHENLHLRWDIPEQLDSMDNLRRWVDGYDTGIRYADTHVGSLLNALADAGVLDDTVIMVGADHGENQGELNVWGDHQTADQITCRVPLIVRWPGLTSGPRVDTALHYHFDWAASMIELAGGDVPASWDGVSFAEAFRSGTDSGRPYVVTSQGAWAVQRGVRFERYMFLRTFHDGHKPLDPYMLFDLEADPHEQHNLAEKRPDLVGRAMMMLGDWQADMMRRSHTSVDPLMTVLREGGPFHTRGELPGYLERLRATGRAEHAQRLAARHPDEL